jgi:HEAT repeat protein
MAKLSAISTLALTALLSGSLAIAASIPLRTKLLRDLANRRGAQFENLVQNWQRNHGTQAVSSLLSIASDKTQKDADRYVALMAAAKIGGKPTSSAMRTYLKDRSWMIRSGALRALRALKDPSAAPAILPLLKDPAMVVRAEAVAAVRELKPAGSPTALAESLLLPENFHAGRALWVPFEATAALIELARSEFGAQGRGLAKDRRSSALPQPWRDVAKTFVVALEKHSTDVRLTDRLTAGLDLIVGKAPAKAATLSDRLNFWKKSL